MKALCLVLALPVVWLAAISGCQPSSGQGNTATTQPSSEIEVYFSPKGGCTDAIVRELAKAKGAIHVQAYSFTSAPIAKALTDAQKDRDVAVSVILDKSQRTEKYSEADFLAHQGAAVWIDSKHHIAHNKIIVIDRETVITGSFNFTKAAEEHNAENLLVIHDPALAIKYLANWQTHCDHSEPYEAK